MVRSREAELRRLLCDLDKRLLQLVTSPEPLDQERVHHIALCETSRQAVQRLLTEAEGVAAGAR
ncbi:MAG TPA: hypothetical protein VFW13_07870 [Phenylobacterium sp.]|nr:hypothetical protein [Phenylobacterium sp.]